MTLPEIEEKLKDYKIGLLDFEDILTAVQQYIESQNSGKPPVSGALPVDKVTRVEVIDKSGRAYVSWNKSNKVEVQLQDDNKTLKVFVSER